MADENIITREISIFGHTITERLVICNAKGIVKKRLEIPEAILNMLYQDTSDVIDNLVTKWEIISGNIQHEG